MATNTLKTYDTLKSSHLPEPQARAIVRAIEGAVEENNVHRDKKLATKVDAAKFALDMSRFEATLNQGMTEFRQEMSGFKQVMSEFKRELSELRQELSGLRQELSEFREKLSEFKQDMLKMESSLRAEIANSKSEMLRWMFVFWIGQVAVMISMIKLLK